VSDRYERFWGSTIVFARSFAWKQVFRTSLLYVSDDDVTIRHPFRRAWTLERAQVADIVEVWDSGWWVLFRLTSGGPGSQLFEARDGVVDALERFAWPVVADSRQHGLSLLDIWRNRGNGTDAPS